MIKRAAYVIGRIGGFIYGTFLTKLFLFSSSRLCHYCGTTNASIVDKMMTILQEAGVLFRDE